MYRQLGKGLSLLLVLLALGWLVHHARPGLAPDPAWIDAEVRGRGVAGTFWFMTVAALFASIGLPRQVVAFLAGYAYGLWAGTGLALAAVVVACVLSFGYGRLAGRWLG
ncbi:MAG TPA: SNARE associated Golgi protein, partial [Thiotrichales bacterium]|nr:SNARE associated Golgi protein [Thiotrichales bacterium]